MQIFQNFGVYSAYIPRLRQLTKDRSNFNDQIKAILNDRYGASHYLQPVVDHSPSAFFTHGDDPVLQSQWAAENGLAKNASLEAVLLAQIEAHNTEIFYNLDPMRYSSDFVRKLPGCVKKSIAWRAAPSAGGDFSAYDLMVCNFPSILESYRQQGMRAASFFPAHDPEMDAYAVNADRPVDVLFVGGYSPYHRQRAIVLEALASQREDMRIAFHLARSTRVRLAETPLGWFPPLKKFRRPHNIRMVSAEPIFGRELYTALSRAKIVFNGAVDMAGNDRGNMRCFEAMGCGALMVSDHGNYPNGMVDGETMLTYAHADEVAPLIKNILHTPDRLRDIANKGYQAISCHYSKADQWQAFNRLVENL